MSGDKLKEPGKNFWRSSSTLSWGRKIHPESSRSGEPLKVETFFVGGGTGGHIYPLLALLSTLVEPQSTLLITGSRAVELRILSQYPFPWLKLPLQRVVLRGTGLLSFLKDFFISFILTLKAFLRYKPRRIVTTGAYLSLPAGIISFLLRIPLYLIEPNSTPGKTSLLLHHIARRIVTVHPSWIRRRSVPVLVGAPVRPQFKTLPSPILKAPHPLLILGGSQGSELFNRVLPQIFHPDDAFEIIHIVGGENLEEVRKRYPRNLKVETLPYAERIWEEMERVQIVLARAGASSLAEFIAARRPAVVVPFPHAGAHQLLNARLFVSRGGGFLVEEGPDFLQRMRQALLKMLEPETYARSVRALEEWASDYDAERISRWLGLI